jgi:hypothetical protein
VLRLKRDRDGRGVLTGWNMLGETGTVSAEGLPAGQDGSGFLFALDLLLLKAAQLLPPESALARHCRGRWL